MAGTRQRRRRRGLRDSPSDDLCHGVRATLSCGGTKSTISHTHLRGGRMPRGPTGAQSEQTAAALWVTFQIGEGRKFSRKAAGLVSHVDAECFRRQTV